MLVIDCRVDRKSLTTKYLALVTLAMFAILAASWAIDVCLLAERVLANYDTLAAILNNKSGIALTSIAVNPKLFIARMVLVSMIVSTAAFVSR